MEARVGEHIDIPSMPVGVPDLYHDHVKLMYDLLALAFQADVTRVGTFMLAREASTRTYNHIGVPDPHHAISHHGNAPDKIAKHAKINTYHASLFAYFLDRLKATPDGDGTSWITRCCCTAAASATATCTRIRRCRHCWRAVRAVGSTAGATSSTRAGTPLTNLLVSILEKVDVPARARRRQHQPVGRFVE